MTAGWKIGADMMMTESARLIAGTVTTDGVPTYEYRFSYVVQSLRDKWPGAFHAL
jgi:para-nitrobenzyl esterase